MQKFIFDPPMAAIVVCSLLVLTILKKALHKDHFYTLVISIAVSLLFVETVCRVFNIGNPQVAIWKEEQIKGEKYGYKPNSKLVYIYPDNPRGYFNAGNKVVGSINSRGFRGSDKEIEKSDGKIRIAFLGDSFTLGIGVRDEDTLPASFEHELKKKYSNIEVLNFGLSNSSTERQIKLLEEYVVAFDPDIVVVVVFLNDANRRGTIRFLSRPKVFGSIRKHSFFVNAFVGGIEKSIWHRKMIQHYRDGYVEGSAGWKKVKSAMRMGKALSKKYNFQFIVTVYPVLFQLDENYPFKNIHQTIESYCLSLDIPFVDLLHVFIGRKDSELWVHRTDQHPNEVAHRIAGAALTEYFDSQGSIKKRFSNPESLVQTVQRGAASDNHSTGLHNGGELGR
ncbi:MAG: hypothetical protein GWN00_28765 [Aliifodinibius sp.]|nr:SGNH/GDSL hydrolase family protein [Fodinibius sp.]NIY28649.1 hypothetical protein [Fodinibius sp.]